MKFSRPIVFILFAMLLLNTQCNEDDSPSKYDPDCNSQNVIINSNAYEKLGLTFGLMFGIVVFLVRFVSRWLEVPS